MTGASAHHGSLGTCEVCGKRCYLTKQAARRARSRRFPGERMSVYRCGDFYHLGHLPGRVIAGDKPRSEIPKKAAS